MQGYLLLGVMTFLRNVIALTGLVLTLEDEN